TSGLDMARSYRALLAFLPDEVQLGEQRVRVEHIVKVARDVPSAVRQAAIEEHASLALFYWKGYARHPRRHTYGQVLDAVLKDPPCDAAIVRPEGWRNVGRVLLPVRGGPSAERALDVALAIADHVQAPLTILHHLPIAH